MSASVKKSFVWLWMAMLLTATVGISVRQLYCYCLGETQLVLFGGSEDVCAVKQAAAELSDCCRKILPDCCAGTNDADDQACTKESTKVFQLKTEFVVDKPLEKYLDCPLWLHDLPFFARQLRPVLCDATELFRAAPPPLPASGREISLRHQLFRC